MINIENNLWKIERDEFYSELYKKYGLEYIQQSGFFFDELEYPLDFDESLMIYCTPVSHIRKPKTNKHCILISSGSYCPVHDGHVETLVKAKERLENAGYEVLGAYMSPDHDNYVSRKNGDKSINIVERNILVTEKIKELNLEEFISLDPWYGTFAQTDLNFTDLIVRTKKYIKRYLDIDTEICYVCGGDNWKFSRTFENKGLCCVVIRPGYNISKDFKETDRIFIVENNNDQSSTKLRKQFNINSEKKNLILRVDDKTHLDKFLKVFEKYFNKIEIVYVEDQKKNFYKFDTNNIISLDSLIKDKYYLEISRMYDTFGHRLIDYYCGSQNLPWDFEGEYVLYDDDIYTGNTMRFAKQLLEEIGIKISSFLSFNISKDENTEILDLRDFICFGGNNGLRINSSLRFPYIYPFVDPRARCSIIDPLQFSIDIWKLNMDLNYNEKVVKNLDYETAQFYCFELGFDSRTYLYDVCKFYYNKLMEISGQELYVI